MLRKKLWADFVNTLFLFLLLGQCLLILFLLNPFYLSGGLARRLPVFSVKDILFLLLLLSSAAMVAACFVSFTRRWPAQSLSIYLDGRLGGEERCVSAYELSKAPRKTPLEAQVLKEGILFLSRSREEKVLSITRLWNGRILAFLFLCCLLLGLIPVYRWERGSKEGARFALGEEKEERGKASSPSPKESRVLLRLFSPKEVFAPGESLEVFLRVDVEEGFPFPLRSRVNLSISDRKMIALPILVESAPGTAMERLFPIDAGILLQREGIPLEGEITLQALLVPEEDGGRHGILFSEILRSNLLRILFSSMEGEESGGEKPLKEEENKHKIPAGKGGQEGKLTFGEGSRHEVRREKKFIEPKVGEGEDAEKEAYALVWDPQAGKGVRPGASPQEPPSEILKKKAEEFIQKQDLTREEARWVREYFQNLREEMKPGGRK